MATLLLCLVMATLLVWKHEEVRYPRFRDWMSGVVVAVLIAFGILFPVMYGGCMAEKSNPITYYAVSEISGKYYYLVEGEWRDVLGVDRLTQSDTLSVSHRKASFSVWYWSISITEAHIPISLHK